RGPLFVEQIAQPPSSFTRAFTSPSTHGDLLAYGLFLLTCCLDATQSQQQLRKGAYVGASAKDELAECQ
ncbi:hypothetical protein, partial [Burkholderia ubonensis]|uniref:hypothetical protein n=1 Tax=Burkholderia ubonensis TaxID=101571 RepID=UPI001E31CBC3